MDIPVIGRLFETTRDDSERTELIMLITPHVIRNSEESRTVSQDFKNKLSTLKNELERKERDRAKSQPKPPPVTIPPTVEQTPNSEKPAPGDGAPRTGASLAPAYGPATPIAGTPTDPGALARMTQSQVGGARTLADAVASDRSV